MTKTRVILNTPENKGNRVGTHWLPDNGSRQDAVYIKGILFVIATYDGGSIAILERRQKDGELITGAWPMRQCEGDYKLVNDWLRANRPEIFVEDEGANPLNEFGEE